MSLPHSYSELYPGRFLKADLLKGQKVTLTIKNLDVQGLVGETNKTENKVIVSFVERSLELVLPKTNGECFRRMFGNDPHAAAGKRVTLFPTTTKFGRDTVDCIRVWGSPDIPVSITITVPQGRKKALEMTMHKVMPGECGFKGSTTEQTAQTTTTAPDPGPVHPRILEIMTLLGWNEDVRANWLRVNSALTDEEKIAKLEPELDS